jgi:hypothetical protein
MRLITKCTLAGFSIALLTAGCQCPCELLELKKVSYTAKYTSKTIKLDGKTRRQWSVDKATLFPAPNSQVTEKTTVKFRWDKKYLYCFAHMVDTDLVTEAKDDDPKSIGKGDSFQLYIRPGKSTVMWRFVVSPKGHKMVYFIPGAGQNGLPSNETAPECKIPFNFKILKVGTLNNYKDKDKFWNVELAIPLKDLEKYGGKIKPGTVWNVLAYRRNYSVHLPDAETSISQQHDDRFWYIMKDKSWAKLKFTK